MSLDYELARELRRLGGEESGPMILEGTVVKTAPLTVSLYGGEVMAPPMPLETAFCAQGFYRSRSDGHLYLDAWRTGDRAVCCIMGRTLVVLGKLAAPDRQIEVR